MNDDILPKKISRIKSKGNIAMYEIGEKNKNSY